MTLRICLPPNCPTPAQMEQQMTVFLTLWWPMIVVGVFLCVSMIVVGRVFKMTSFWLVGIITLMLILGGISTS